jgi:hypothetical protein
VGFCLAFGEYLCSVGCSQQGVDRCTGPPGKGCCRHDHHMPAGLPQTAGAPFGRHPYAVGCDFRHSNFKLPHKVKLELHQDDPCQSGKEC